MMREVHQRNELGFFHLIKWLVACNNPLGKELLELFLVPWPLSINP
jgi:hypothetical protein